MKKIIIALFAFFLILSNSTSAFQFRVEASLYQEDYDYIWTEVDVTISIYVNNDDRTMLGWSSPFKFYGTGDVTNIEFSTPTSWIVSEEFINIWDMGAWSVFESWDGDLTTPDQFCFSGISYNGWQPGTHGEILAFKFIFEIPSPYDDCATVLGNICIDSGDFQNDTYDWLFDLPLSFGGPYCFTAKHICCYHTIITNCIQDSIAGYIGQQISYDFDFYHPVGTPSMISIQSGPGIINSATGLWTWIPESQDFGTHRMIVSAYPTENHCISDRCYYDVIIRALCGDANGNGSVNLLDITFLISYLYKEGPIPQPIEIADVDNSGTINLLDITYLITYLYQNGPEPNCPDFQ